MTYEQIAAICLRATAAYGVEEFDIADYPEASFERNFDTFKDSLRSMDDEMFFQILPEGTDGQYETIDAEYGIKRLKK